MGAALSFYLSRGGRRPVPVAQPPIAVGDSRDILANETTVQVNVLANDLHVAGAAVTIPTPATGANAAVVGSAIHVTRIGSAAGSYSLTYRVTTAKGSSDATLSGTIAAAAVAPTAVNDTRDLTAVEITAPVDVLANDSNVTGAVVTVQGAVTGADAAVAADGQTIVVTRNGTGAGAYSLTYRVTTDGGFDEAVLSGNIAELQEVGIALHAGTTASPGAAIEFRAGTTASPGAIIPFRAGTSGDIESDIPADALDRSAYGSTAAWIADMTAQGKPGKVASGTYTFTQRQILTQSIYGYGITKPVFKGPGSTNATRALSFLYPHAPNIRVTNIAFEDINMPFISCDDTVDDDWGDALIPMSGYGWNSAEYGLSSHRYNQDLIDLHIDHCDFSNCGVCVMLVRHGDSTQGTVRIHDGLTFTDNVVRNGMGCVCLLGYQFRNFDLSRNDVRDMVGSSFGGSSANHTETIFMLGGINNPLRDDYMATNSAVISNNTVIGFTSSHPQNNKNGAVYMDIRGGGNILSESNHVENCYSTGGTQDCNAVYLKSRGNIRFRNNLYRNCGARPVDSGANHGSESQFYTFKGDTTDVISEDDTFETGPQCGNSPWIQAGTATDFTMIRPTFRGWRNDGTWWGRPGVPCMIHHWQGDRFVTVDAVLENCGWTGTQAYAVAHRDRAGGVCSHTGMRADFQSNATGIIGKGAGTATVSLVDCQNTIGQNLTLVTGIS